MKTFKDSAGRNWTITINVDTVKRLIAGINVNLCELNEGDPPLILALERDASRLFDVVFEVIRPQAETLGVTAQQLAAGIDGPSLAEMATAFWGELADFFRPLRPATAKMIQDVTAIQQPPTDESGPSSGGSPGSSGSTPES